MGVFVQVAGDNNAMNEDTRLDGKRITQATTRVLFQRGQLGNASKLQVYVDQTKRKRSIESMLLCQSIRQYSAYGKRPAVTCFSGRTRDGWSKCNERLHSEAYMMDLTWTLVRMPPLKLFGVYIFPSDKQTVSEWSGFNALFTLTVADQGFS